MLNLPWWISSSKQSSLSFKSQAVILIEFTSTTYLIAPDALYWKSWWYSRSLLFVFFYFELRKSWQTSETLRWLKTVSTLPSNALIGRISATTLYHVLAILWYQMKHGLLLNKMQSLLWHNTPPWQRGSTVKTSFILSLVAYISKMNSVTPIFYFWKVIRRARWNVLQS